jgi:hypothetical protein
MIHGLRLSFDVILYDYYSHIVKGSNLASVIPTLDLTTTATTSTTMTTAKCGVVRCGVVRCGVVWCGRIQLTPFCKCMQMHCMLPIVLLILLELVDVEK